MRKHVKQLLIILLVFLDQAIKLTISAFFLSYNVPIIKGYISFLPVHNDKYSYLGSLLNLNFGKALNSIIVVISMILIYYLYKFAIAKNKSTRFVNASFIFFISGCICSLIDRVFWSGSLDYISLHGFFVFDLKDVLLSLGAAMIVLEVIVYIKQNPKKTLKTGIKEDIALIKEFMNFVKKDMMKRVRISKREF